MSLVVVGGAQPLEKKPCMLGMHGTERWGSDFLLSLGGWGVGVSDFLLPLGSREVGDSSDFLLPLGDVGGTRRLLSWSDSGPVGYLGFTQLCDALVSSFSLCQCGQYHVQRAPGGPKEVPGTAPCGCSAPPRGNG